MLLSIKRDILAALAYFDLFDYPLTDQEVFERVQAALAKAK